MFSVVREAVLGDGVLSDATLRSLQAWLHDTPVGEFMRVSRWAWPICESLHFLGMSVLVGVIGLFDLRLLGFARGVPIAAFHRLIPVGVAGFVLNAMTGVSFLSATPDQYLFNAAFRFKVTFFLVAGVNVLVFYAATFKRLLIQGPGEAPILGARLAGGVSLCAWIGVMAAGRLLTFFRP
jgi:hypothetical protein